MNVELSVIVPAYNAEQYLAECLDSLLNSTYQDYEILVIDDGSTDGTAEICDRYQREHPRIRVFHTENRKLPSARNLGIEYAAGQFIGFVDADDLVARDMFDKLIGAMTDDTQLGICQHRNCLREDAKNVLGGGTCELRILSRKDIAECIPSGGAGPYVWNKIYRRDVLARNGIRFRVDAQGAEDLYFNVEYLQCCEKAIFIKEPLYFHIATEGSIMSTFRDKCAVGDQYMNVPRSWRYSEKIVADISREISYEYQARAAMFYQTILRKLETPSQEYICEAIDYVKKNKSSLLRHRWGWKYYCSALLLCVNYRLWASVFRRAAK